ncbi:amidohydrolase family protein [Mycobacterium sp.]|uniref:amidohydrolase family protein n=1 Tax=Mycobacterium sp. TaxID=1785 RepID=UPI002C98A9B7|nr:amidohydrolase family protein [Mycobacterium sp.]HME47839.1 amidohydrolase family protein [Mycobacterium sp.]
MNSSPGLIDVHHHIVPREYAKALAKLGVTKGLGVQLPKWDVHKALGVMDEHGISSAVLSISAPGVYFRRKDPGATIAAELSRQMNEICAELVKDHPGRFGAFATLPIPDVEATLAEIAYSLDELRLSGVLLLTNYDGYYLGDPRFDAVFAELNRRKAVVFVHPQTPPGREQSHLDLPEAMLDVCFDTTRTAFSLIVNGVTKNYPDVRFILSHAGGAVPYLAGRVGITTAMAANLKGATPLVADGIGKLFSMSHKLEEKIPEQLSYYLRLKSNVLPGGFDHFLSRFYYDTALSASPHCFASLLTVADTSHILFGTDYIFATEAAVPATITGIHDCERFTAADIRAIERDTALTLFPTLRPNPV